MSRRLMALLVALALLAAACGGADTGSEDVASVDDNPSSAPDNPDNPSSGDDAGEVDVEAALLAFARCMRDEGFDIEDPTVDADGNVHLPSPEGGDGGHASTEELQEAARGACGEYLEGVTQTAEHGDDTDQLDAQLAFAQCMRDQGIDYDDPDPSGEGGGHQQLDENDPDVQAALEVCRPEVSHGGSDG